MIAAVTLPSTPDVVAALSGDREGSDPAAQERAWVEQAQQGDMRAFRRIYDLHAARIFRGVLMPMLKDPHLAEDLVADTFVKALEYLPRYTWKGRGIGPWLSRIAKNLALDHLRRSGRFTGWPEGLEQCLPTPGDEGAETLLGRAELSTLLGARMDEVVRSLNPRYQKVLRLRMFDKRPRAEAAAELEVSVGTLDVLLHRACKAFRREYQARFAADSQSELFEP